MKKEKVFIGARIKNFREIRGLSQKELAEKSGISLMYLIQLEKNLSSPSLSVTKQITDSLGITLSDFFYMGPMYGDIADDDDRTGLISATIACFTKLTNDQLHSILHIISNILKIYLSK